MNKLIHLMDNYITALLFIIYIFFLKLKIFHCECGRDVPILIDNQCQLQYCNKAQFDSGDCKIDNSIVNITWLNDIILFDFYKFRFGNFAMNSNGDMIYECSDEETKGIRLFYGLKNDGSYYFKEANGTEVPTRIITVIDQTQTEEEKKYPARYESNNIFASINNSEYLISISLHTAMFEIYDLEKKEVSFVPTTDFTDYNIYTYISNLIEIKNGNNKQYLHTFIGRNKDNQDYTNFYLISQIYSFSKNKISLGEGYKLEARKIVKWSEQHPRIVSSFFTNSNIFVLFFLEYNKYTIETYNNNIMRINSFEISSIEGYLYQELFYKCIYLKDNFGAFTFYLNENYDSRPQLKIIEIYNNGNSITDKYNFQLYDFGDYSTKSLFNDMIKINDKSFLL